MMVYLELLVSFVEIGLLGFGGGMAIIGLIQQKVEQYGWMSGSEFLDIFAISQMTPGPIGINCATYVGYTAAYEATGSHLLGVLGSAVATIAIILPSLVIMMILAAAYNKISGKWGENRIYQGVMLGIRVLVLYLIASAAYSLLDPAAIRAGESETIRDGLSWAIFAVVFALSVLPKRIQKKMPELFTSPISLILCSGAIGLVVYHFLQ